MPSRYFVIQDNVRKGTNIRIYTKIVSSCKNFCICSYIRTHLYISIPGSYFCITMSAFQTAVLLIFGAFLIAGVVVLAVFKTDSSGGGSGIPVIIWGTLRAEDIGALIPKVIGDDKSIEIQYV